MSLTLNPPETGSATVKEHSVVLHSISWATYESLLKDLADCSAPRVTYDRGELEIMSPTPEHELINDAVRLLVNIVAEELNVEVRGLGSTTFRRKDFRRGFEPDACFYIANVERIIGKTRLDLKIDPPPDLIIEVDITSPSLDKFPLFAQLGVPEVWRYAGAKLTIYQLADGIYVERETSISLTRVKGEAVGQLLHESQGPSRLAWIRRVRAWARSLKEDDEDDKANES